MKDSLGNLFRERFQGHEVPVAPGTWQAIQNQMAAPAPATQEPAPGQLQEKFAGHEVNVDPAVWQNISAQIGHGVAAGTTGGGFMSGLGWAAAGVAGLLVAGGLIYVLNTDEPVAGITPAPVTESAQPAQPEPAKEVAVVPPANSTSMEEAVTTRPVAIPSRNRTINAVHGSHVAPKVVVGATGEVRSVPATTERPGEEVVSEIIHQMTSEVEQEVRADKGAATNETLAVKPPVLDPLMPGLQLPEPTPLPKLFVPNVFTPNGDNVNDVYQVTSEGDLDIKMRVFSVKSNQMVFSSNSNEPWTGANCEDGYYMVAVEAITPDGRMVTAAQVVWLNRNSTN